MNPAEWLHRTSHLSPDASALFQGQRCVADYAEFNRRAASIGASLASRHGVGPSNRVAIFMKNRTDYLEALYGVWYCGAAVIPINSKLHSREAAWIIENAQADVALVSDDIGAPLAKVAPDCLNTVISADDDAWRKMYRTDPMPRPEPINGDQMIWLFYTSGTTGKPKGVMITARNLEHMALNYFSDVDPVQQEDAILYAAPMSHGAGIYNFMHVIKRARHIVPESGGFEPKEILSLSAALRSISMFAAPTMVKRLVEYAKANALNGDGIKTISYAGGPMYVADIVEAVDVMGDRFVQVYGQGECPMGITALPRRFVSDRIHPRWKERLASVGTAQSSVRVAIFDPNGNSLPSGSVGEIVVSGPTVMSGYWNNPEATGKTIKDGWLWTGDMGAMDEDGFVTLHDRSKDMIISGGSNIYPREVEEVLLEIDGVTEVAVVGKPDPDWGEIVVAFVVSNGEVTSDHLDTHCIDNIARFKRPKSYQFIGELPKNNYGKILKTELRSLLVD
ncbi:MAG: AMP-binding protein [Paracoccaceae bacterium]|nr:AMP-binding protein [Paracoccaceae bacterium]MDG2259278.1 AMP-binding protein [Paracoccaceae bacterium]